jgi:hypothetical protein
LHFASFTLNLDIINCGALWNLCLHDKTLSSAEKENITQDLLFRHELWDWNQVDEDPVNESLLWSLVEKA